MNLYEIKEQFRAWQLKISNQDGELTEEDLQVFNELEGLAEDKIEAYAVIIKESLAEAEMYKKEAERLMAIAKRKNNLAERLKNNLDGFMKEQGREKFESLKATITYRKSTKLEIDENVKLPKKWQKVITEIDKTLITNFLKEGGKLKGCQLVTKQNIQIK